MKKYRSLFGIITLITIIGISLFAVTGCALFKPTAQGDCPTLTTQAAELAAFGATTAALKNGAPTAIITLIESNITAAVATGQFNADLIVIAIKNVPQGAQWLPYLGAIDVVFGKQFNSIVNSNVNKQVCVVPIANAIVDGMQLAQTLNPSTTGILKAVAPSARSKAEARLQYLLRKQ